MNYSHTPDTKLTRARQSLGESIQISARIMINWCDENLKLHRMFEAFGCAVWLIHIRLSTILYVVFFFLSLEYIHVRSVNVDANVVRSTSVCQYHWWFWILCCSVTIPTNKLCMCWRCIFEWYFSSGCSVCSSLLTRLLRDAETKPCVTEESTRIEEMPRCWRSASTFCAAVPHHSIRQWNSWCDGKKG